MTPIQYHKIENLLILSFLALRLFPEFQKNCQLIFYVNRRFLSFNPKITLKIV